MPVVPRLLRPSLAVAASAALVAGAVLGASPATAADPAPAVSALWETTPAASVAAATDYVPVPVDLSAAGATARLANTAGGPRLETVDAQSGAVLTDLDLSSHLDEAAEAFGFVDWDTAGYPLRIVVRGSHAGAPVLVRIDSTSGSSIVSPTVSDVPAGTVDLSTLAMIDRTSSGVIVIVRMPGGGYQARTLSFALTPVGTPVDLALPAAGARTFAMVPSYGNIVSVRDGALDVVSTYVPGSVVSTDVPGLAASARIVSNYSTVVAADDDGTVAIADVQFGGTTSLRSVRQATGGSAGVVLGTQLEEVQLISAAGDGIQRFALADGAERPALALDGVRVVPGSADNARTAAAVTTFVGDVAGAPYAYATGFRSRPSVSYSSDLVAAARGAGVELGLGVRGTGALDAEWEYSLDGGASWAARNASWSSASPDPGDVTTAPDSLPAPLDGRAPFLRQGTDEAAIAPVNLSRTEYDVVLPDYGYDALWRVRAANELGSAASAPQHVTIADSGPADPAPRITRHPAPVVAVAGEHATFVAASTGSPTPSVRWERSSDGTTWRAIADATEPTLVLGTALEDSGALVRAVFTNGSGTATTEAARLDVLAVVAPTIGAAPAGAQTSSGATLSLDLSTYAHDWRRETASPTVTMPASGGFVFSQGAGWVVPGTGEAQLVWAGTASYRPYGGLNGIRIALANPVLHVAADHRATLTADVFWNNGGGMGGTGSASDSGRFERVLLATFADVAVSVADGTVTVSGTPEWARRTWVSPVAGDATVSPSSFPASFLGFLDPALRPWFYASGSGRDPEKPMNPIAVSARIDPAAATGAGAVVDPVDPMGAGTSPFARSAPILLTGPVAVSQAEGSEVVLTASAKGNPAPTVVWQLAADGGWRDIPGAVDPALRLAGLTVGTYDVRAVFSNSEGTTATTPATVTVTLRAAGSETGAPPSGADGAAPVDGSALASTGTPDVSLLVAAALGLVLAGGIATTLGRRIRPARRIGG